MIDNLEKKQKIKNYACHPAFILSLPVVDEKMLFNFYVFGNISFYLHRIPDPHLDFVFTKIDHV